MWKNCGCFRFLASSSVYDNLSYPVVNISADGSVISTNLAANTMFRGRPTTLFDFMSHIDANRVLSIVPTSNHLEAWWDGQTMAVQSAHSNGIQLSRYLRFSIIANRSRHRNPVMTLSFVPVSDLIKTILETWFRQQLPSSVIDCIANQNSFDMDVVTCNVTVMFIDIVGFTHLASRVEPSQVLMILKTFFQIIEREIDKCPRIITYETDGDCWIGISGIAQKNSNGSGSFAINNDCDNNTHDQSSDALAMLTLAMAIKAATTTLTMPDNLPIKLRIGLNSGPVAVGLISGHMKLAGNTINVAKRVEAACPVGAINMSTSTYDLIPDRLKRMCKTFDAYLKGKGITKLHCIY